MSYYFDRIALSHTGDVSVDGGWGDWSQWSACSKTCGSGEKTRSRQCDSPAPSHGGDYCLGGVSRTSQRNTCYIRDCTGTYTGGETGPQGNIQKNNRIRFMSSPPQYR